MSKIDLKQTSKVCNRLKRWNDKHPKDKYSVLFFGQAGIGKTYGLIGWAKERNYDYVVVPLAQFNETGDLIGVPEKDSDRKKTIYYPPSWWPDEDFEGVMILDDFNRANNLILQASLHLLQFYEVCGNMVPEKCLLAGTANPYDDDYIVQEVDDAALTRPLKYDIKFDPVIWAKQYAVPKGLNDVYINFILKNPEWASTDWAKTDTGKPNVQGGSPINIRAWTKVFTLCTPNDEDIELIANGSVGTEASSALLQWINEENKWIRDFKPELAWSEKKTDREQLVKQMCSLNQKHQQLFLIRKMSTYNTQDMSKKQRNSYADFWTLLANKAKENQFPADFLAWAVHYLYKFDEWFVINNPELLDVTTAEIY